MLNKIISACFMLGCIVMGALWGSYLAASNQMTWTIVGGIAGGVIAGNILFALRYVTQDLFERFSPALVFIALAMMVGYMLSRYIRATFWTGDDPVAAIFLTATLVLVFGFIGISLGVTRATNWDALLRAVQRREVMETNPKILDTSVIIDGRLADICKTGFIEGTLIIPRFVLQELQRIADAADDLRRARGRRGLDILKQLQDPATGVTVQVLDADPVDIREVDEKLVRLARDMNAKIVTNDLNLNKVAQIEGVVTLNINDLANALKPAVLPDERMQVRIVKEGKEAFQGVGYLDDGTMIVVDGGREYIGREVSVLVTSVLQTTAGRMIFTRLQNVLS